MMPLISMSTTHHTNAGIPAGACEDVLADVVPVDGKNLLGMLVPMSDGMILEEVRSFTTMLVNFLAQV